MHSIRLSHCIYRGSLFFLILLTAAAVALSAADVIIQALANQTGSGAHDYRNLIVVVVSYVVLVKEILIVFVRSLLEYNRLCLRCLFHAVGY